MRNCMQFISPLIVGFLIFNVSGLVHTKSIIEPCNTSDSCPSLLSYLLPWDSKLSEIASRFHVNVSDILAANSVFPITPSFGNKILSAKSLVKIPISCPCVNGIRWSMSTFYTVQAADTLDSLSDGYGGLVSAEQIMRVNKINATNPLTNGGSIVIPLPCTCFDNVNNGGTAIYMSYVVQKGESLGSIAAVFGTTVTDLESVNGLGQVAVDPGDILAVPIAEDAEGVSKEGEWTNIACSSATLNWYNESLIVPNGSYALTATNCIKCICAPIDLKLQCLPSGLDIPCYNLRCKESNLIIGEEHMRDSKTGCNVSQCVYRGHRGGKILSSVMNSSYLKCPGNRSYSGASRWPSPQSNPVDPPFVTSYPTPSPSPLPVSDASGGRLGHVSFINVLQLFLPKLILYFFM